MKKKIAVIDLGSNSVRLNVFGIYEDGSYRVIDEFKESVRLSENMGDDMMLKPKAMNRTISVLKMFKKIIESHNVTKMLNFATAAVRNSNNGKAFLDLVKRETGLNIEVISGKKESYLGFMGVINTIDIDDCLIIDTGGGSTEFTLVKERQIKNSVSIPLGAVVLSERFLCDKEDVEGLNKYIKESIGNYDWLNEAKGLPIIGLGGTIRTLAKIDRSKKQINFDKVSQYKLKADRVKEIASLLEAKTVEQRKEVKGLDSDRADIIIGGMAPLLYILDKYDNPYVVVSNTGLRDGIFFDYYFKNDGVDWDGMSALERSIENTIINFGGNIVHSRNVARISISLFKQLKKLHKMKDDYLHILYTAAMLRDIGIYVNYENYRRHSMYLMLNSNIHGLEIKELLMAAMVICFNENEKTFGILDNLEVENVKKLACIVNLAGRLDKYSTDEIKYIECTENSDLVQIKLDKNFCLIDFACQRINEDDEFFKLFGKKLIIG